MNHHAMIGVIALALSGMSLAPGTVQAQAETATSQEQQQLQAGLTPGSKDASVVTPDVSPLPPGPQMVRVPVIAASWALPERALPERSNPTSAFSRVFHLAEFDHVNPVGPWADNSCGPFAVACLLEASRGPLSSRECLDLQEELDPDHRGTTTAEIADWLRQHWRVEEMEPATDRAIIDHLHLGFPALVTLNLSNSTHWALVTGYVTSADGQIESWLLVDNGVSVRQMPNTEFQGKWLGREFKCHALFIGPLRRSDDSIVSSRVASGPVVSCDAAGYQLSTTDKIQILLRRPTTGAPIMIVTS